ncbi:parallel beta helix pectate lyase-like protein [Motilibacter peucedani]|uniref:Parallel beta helix pectate lyase-like protein n=1 Tax=Motilibacter peucedani TaxID=598650 RepID=A0A420XK05_9ACTN|nr:right-handed parallel beta-helix repeat-containing protein [Motilibacter peucedani]RKS67963.1 parallel beta helix pectate lyase-like protein [Motilibacter peucedani]
MHLRLPVLRPLVALGAVAALVTAAAPAANAATARAQVVRVATSAQLVAALAHARPGDVVSLADGTYDTHRGFTASRNGTAREPITLKGSRRAVVTGGGVSGHYGLWITGDHWRVVGLTVARADKGIVLDGSVGTVIDSVDVHDVGAEGIHFRSSSSDGVVRRSTVRRTGRVKAQFGEGVYVGSAHTNWRSKHKGVRFGEHGGHGPDRSDRVVVERNAFSDTTAEAVDVKEGTTGGVIRANTFRNTAYAGGQFADSWVDVKGNGWTVSGNRGTGPATACPTAAPCRDAFQVHSVLPGWGTGNLFAGNTVQGGVPGYVVAVEPADPALGTVVRCDDTGAAAGTSNLPCVP